LSIRKEYASVLIYQEYKQLLKKARKNKIMTNEQSMMLQQQLGGYANTYMTGQVQGQANSMANQRTIDLMGLQNQYQKGLSRHGSELQYQQWLRTGAEAQKDQLKKAGLNPALMYKSGGVQGTTGTQTGGQQSMGDVKHAPYMDIAGLMEQASRSRLNNAQADAIEQKIPDEVSNLQFTGKNIQADTKMKESIAALNDILGHVGKQSVNESIAKTNALISEKALNEEQAKLIKKEVLYKEMQTKLAKAGINKTNQEITTMMDQIEIAQERNEIEWGKLDIQNGQLVVNQDKMKDQVERTRYEKFEKEMKAKYPSIWNVIGKNFNNGLNMINWCFGGGEQIEGTEINDWEHRPSYEKKK
jgi:hypothetical protein